MAYIDFTTHHDLDPWAADQSMYSYANCMCICYVFVFVYIYIYIYMYIYRRGGYVDRGILSLRTLGISWSKILGCCCCCCCCSAALDRTASNYPKIPSSFFSRKDLKSEIWTHHPQRSSWNFGPDPME